MDKILKFCFCFWLWELKLFRDSLYRQKVAGDINSLNLLVLYNFHREHSLLKIKKKLSPIINVKNITKSSLAGHTVDFVGYDMYWLIHLHKRVSSDEA